MKKCCDCCNGDIFLPFQKMKLLSYDFRAKNVLGVQNTCHFYTSLHIVKDIIFYLVCPFFEGYLVNFLFISERSQVFVICLSQMKFDMVSSCLLTIILPEIKEIFTKTKYGDHHQHLQQVKMVIS